MDKRQYKENLSSFFLHFPADLCIELVKDKYKPKEEQEEEPKDEESLGGVVAGVGVSGCHYDSLLLLDPLVKGEEEGVALPILPL